MRRQGPLVGSYAAAVGLVVLALAPNIVVTTAIEPLIRGIGMDVHLGETSVRLVEGLSNAGYAFGAVLASQLMQRLRPRRLIVVYELFFVAASAIAAGAAGPGMFIAGRIVQGVATGMLLVAALPPLIQQFPPKQMPKTAIAVNLAFFGAVMVGPMAGGLFAAHMDWRLLFVMVAVLGLGGLLLAAGTFEPRDPHQPDLPWDVSAIGFAFAGMGLAFTGVTELRAVGFTGALFLAPTILGVACIVALIALEFRRERPLMPVRELASTLPVSGIVTAMVAGAALVTLILLVQSLTAKGLMLGPSHAGRLFWPGVVAVCLAAAGFGAVFRTRFTQYYALGGMLVTVAAAALLVTIGLGAGDVPILALTGLIGFAAGATVSPGLFLAAFGVRSAELGRTFAIVELLRSAAAYLLAPVLLYVVSLYGKRPGDVVQGVQIAAWITLGVTAAGILVILALYFLGGGRPAAPDLEQWLGEGEHAIDSRPLLAEVRE